MAKKTESWLDRLLLETLIVLATGYIKLIRATARVEHLDEHYPQAFWDKGEPFIGTLWHGRFIMMPYGWRTDHPIGAIVSRHGDGEFISRVLTNFNFVNVRGSSNAAHKKRKDRGGAEAFRAMVKALRGGTSMGITLDGPKGPRMRAKEGAIMLARLTGKPILPVAFSASRGMIVKKSWDSFLLAWPFSRAAFKWGPPIHVPRDATPEILEEKRLELETTLNQLTDELDRKMGRTPVMPGEEGPSFLQDETEAAQSGAPKGDPARAPGAA